MKGTYLVKTVMTALTKSGQNETPAVKFIFDIIQNVDSGQAESGSIHHYLYLTQNAFNWTMKVLCDVVGFDRKGSSLSVFNEGAFEGAEFWAVIDEEEYNGKVSDKIQFLNKIGDRGPVKKVEKNEISELDKRVAEFNERVEKKHAGEESDTSGLPF